MNAKGCDANIDAIYDEYDSASRGLVTYCDYAVDPFGDQPTIFFGDNAGQHELYWNPKANLAYDLIRGDLANLALMGVIVDLGAVNCEQQIIGSGSIIDVSPGNYGLDSSRERASSRQRGLPVGGRWGQCGRFMPASGGLGDCR